ncbi:MAG: PilZ domain-containing protein [Betaproteobacteria bacterium]|jgi:CheY-like chemotaxis protein
MPGRVFAAGLDARELRLEVPFLQREPGLLFEAATGGELLQAVERFVPELVVVGTRLVDETAVEVVKRLRAAADGRRLSILAVVRVDDLPGSEGELLAAGANAALRRPLDRFVLESWIGKLVDVPRRVRARIPVHVQVVGSRHSAPGEHFYALSRNLSLHGMLLASPVRIEASDLDLELDLPEPEGRLRALGRVAREAPEVGWPYVGYGIEFLYLPDSGRRAIGRMVRREGTSDVARGLWAPGAIHCTLRRDQWIYELTEPARTDKGFLVEVRRAGRDDWRPGRAAPFTVVRGDGALATLEAAREFVRRHG